MNENVISFFQDVNKTINIFSINIELRTLLIIFLMILVTACLFFLLYTFISRILMEQRLISKNIKVRRTKREYSFIKKILKSFDSDELQLRFLHSGGVMGITTVEIYFIYKVLFTVLGLILGLRLYQSNNVSFSIFLIVLLGGLGYFLVDLILYKGKKDRTKSIKEQLPMFLVSFDNYTKAGLLFEDILDIMPKLIHGDLQKELIRFNVSYSLSKDFEGCIKEFTKRLGIVEADELELKMRQCYYSGIYDDVLTNEKELIERKIVNDMRKESQLYNLYLAIAIAMMIVNIFVLVVIPIFNIASRDYKMFLGF
jgi:Flp pilus assembly protein TadB